MSEPRISPELDQAIRAAVAARCDGDVEEFRQLYESARRRLAWRARRGFKVCSRCKERLKPAAFGRSAKSPDGLYHRCRACERGRKRVASA